MKVEEEGKSSGSGRRRKLSDGLELFAPKRRSTRVSVRVCVCVCMCVCVCVCVCDLHLLFEDDVKTQGQRPSKLF